MNEMSHFSMYSFLKIQVLYCKDLLFSSLFFNTIVSKKLSKKQIFRLFFMTLQNVFFSHWNMENEGLCHFCFKGLIGRIVFNKIFKNSHRWSTIKGNRTSLVEFSWAKQITFCMPYQFEIKATSSVTANVTGQFFFSAKTHSKFRALLFGIWKC